MRKTTVTGLTLAGMMAATSVFADGEPAGDFDYYVLAMSWSPTWCALEGDDRNSPQCDRNLGWVLHGLWPQYENGWPSYCHTSERDPSKQQTAAMEDIMGTDGAAWYQWKKHGRCAGLPAQEYLDTARKAYDNVTRPAAFRNLGKDVLVPASVVEQAFMGTNVGLDRDEITVTCKDNRIQEVRICLSKDLEPRTCGQDTIRDCTLDKARLDKID
ncbi:ribonuclease T2 family protein [Pacificibacter marinus]|uniref:Ribonuclease I n=1 Tax=Pacificibacter marinus TaxID=658057 RepID=A0A1Y5SAZ1_9RHOB|nr:ribonuclease T2 [Pacificibacter marinus]SEK77946.1 ribonuclease T2 [Pacificibacter marinus]SLN33931.1 ribonuclease I [Pacificibacter marinus]